MMLKNRKISQRGQSLVLVTLLLFVLVGILALVLDGGFTYSQRRAAQNAADAGALAGARSLCIGIGSPLDVAYDYAVNRNQADTALASFVGTGQVQVDTTITYNTFFAAILGHPQMTVAATATAGCFVPSAGQGILPVAWSCRLPAVGQEESNSDDCVIEYGEDKIYLIMDDYKLQDKTCEDPTSPDYNPLVCDFYCQDPLTFEPAGALDCDLNNDGVNDVIAGGDRSWLDLAYNTGPMDLTGWIRDGYAGEVKAHTWFGGQPGSNAAAFMAAEDRIGDMVILPVFNLFCNKDTPGGCPYACPEDLSSPSITDIFKCDNSYNACYHVNSFSLFTITCVSMGQNDECPAKNQAAASITDDKLQKDFLKTMAIEGYFTKGFVPGLSGQLSDGDEAGAFVIYLTN